jgi:putative tricarboxylic transport membrane protein
MHNSDNTDEPSLVSVRTMDVLVSLLMMVGSGIVILDATRLGFGWVPNEGPAAGLFPFYIAVVLAISSVINLVNALRSGEDGRESFVSRPAAMRVLTILVPSFGYVLLISYLGLYVASAIFIIGFMLTLGRETILRSLLVGLGVPLVLFVMFEIWFLVPLPKGPVEAMLGF